MMRRNLFFAAALTTALFLPLTTQAQVNISTEKPLVYSKTVIGIVPSGTIPKIIRQAPELQGAVQASQPEPETPPAAESDKSKVGDKEKPPLPEIDQTSGKRTLTVQVRGQQIALNSGMINNYQLDDKNGVLTFFAQAEPRRVLAENIQKPVDILFINDEGMVVQIIPEVIPAYLPDDIGTDFPLRALLYIRAGAAADWGIQPGYRIEHGMFNPKPLIYMSPNTESQAITVE